MFKRKLNIVLAFAVCAILLPMTMSAEDQVTRPFKAQSNATQVVNLMTGDWLFEEWGEGTHTGRYTNEGSGHPGYGSGVLTAADGDQIFWDVTQVGGNPPVVVFTGGTGRFENASGELTGETSNMEVVIDWPTMTITATVHYTGWIRY